MQVGKSIEFLLLLIVLPLTVMAIFAAWSVGKVREVDSEVQEGDD